MFLALLACVSVLGARPVRRQDLGLVDGALKNLLLGEIKKNGPDIKMYPIMVYCISLTADGPQRARLVTNPSYCNVANCLCLRRVFPFLPCSRLTIFYRDAYSARLQLVNHLVARICILRAFGLQQMPYRRSLMVLGLFCFVSKPRPFAQSFFDITHAPRQPHAITLQLFASFFVLVSFFFFLFFCLFGDDAFSECFCTITFFSLLNGDYYIPYYILYIIYCSAVRRTFFFLPGWLRFATL